jgi:hypothetical protein
MKLPALAGWLELKRPSAIAGHSAQSAAQLLSLFFRLCEMLILTVVLQIEMLPLLARDLHRVTLRGPLANLFAVLLTGVLVPLVFATLFFALFFHPAALYFVSPLRWLTTLLLFGINSLGHSPCWSYRIPTHRIRASHFRSVGGIRAIFENFQVGALGAIHILTDGSLVLPWPVRKLPRKSIQRSRKRHKTRRAASNNR